MSDTNFIPQVTPIVSTWTQDVNNTIYRLLGNSTGAGGTGGAPLTRAAVMQNLGAVSASNAAATYETIAGAAATYETIAGAAATYETIAGAAAATAALRPAFKNRILNGAMQIAQRPLTAVSAGGLSYGGADRFQLYTVGSTGRLTLSTGTGEFTYAQQFSVTSFGNTVFQFGQRIESLNIADLAGQTVTLSFWAHAAYPVTGTVQNVIPTTIDDYSSANAIQVGVCAVSAVWTKFTYTFSLPSTATNGAGIEWLFTNLSNGQVISLTGVQLEAGSSATAYDHREYTQELLSCQRYYTYGDDKTFVVLAAVTYPSLKFAVPMRVTPSMTYVFDIGGGASFSVGAMGFYQTVGNSTDSGMAWTASAEL